MSNPVIVGDIEARWRTLSPTEALVAQALLDDAWAVLVARLPLLDSRVISGSISPALVTQVVTAMALRVLRNPDGKRQESIDDYSWTRDDTVSSGGLYVSEDEVRLLSGQRGRAFSISPGY